MYYKEKKISKELYDWMCRLKIADQPLISKWRKPGFEILCSMIAISQQSTNFGTTSICRVPMRQRGGGIMPAEKTGCVSCCSGDGVDGGPIWWCDPRPTFGNPYGTGAPPGKKQRVDSDAADVGEAAVGDSAPDEPELDDAIKARLALLKGDAGATVD